MLVAEKEKHNSQSKKTKDHQSSQANITNFDKMMQKSLKQKLLDQTTKNDLLQETVTRQKETFKTILEGEFKDVFSHIILKLVCCLDLKYHHEARLFEMENTLTLTQQLVKNQSTKLADQVEKLVLSDNIIEQLVAENEKLTFQLTLSRPVAS